MRVFADKTYRSGVSPAGLVSFGVRDKETDLLVSAERDMRKAARGSVARARSIIERYGRGSPPFFGSLEPLDAPDDAHPLIKSMCFNAGLCGVGPMAAVAGAVAEFVGSELAGDTGEIIVENGGDIFMRILRRRLVGIYAGDSVLSGRFALELEPGGTPCGVCSSSGTFGHSLNFGKADAVVAVADSAALADAAATACSNMVKDETCIGEAIAFARSVEGVRALAAVVKDRFGVWGIVQIREIALENNR